MKPYGQGGRAADAGYNLATIIGWLEALTSEEEETAKSAKAKRRMELVESATQLLNDADDM
jgi:hypothetical protein